MKMKVLAISTLILASTAGHGQTADGRDTSIRQVKAHIQNVSGQKLYVVTLNPFEIRAAGLNKRNAPQKKTSIECIDESAHQPAGWSVVNQLAKKYQFTPTEVYTWSSPSLAWLHESQAKLIASDPLGTGVSEDEMSK